MAAAQTYQSEFTGAQMDARFTAVATLTAALEELTAVVAGKYVKPADGIPSSDMTAAVQASLAKAETAVQSLADYYTKTEVDQLLAAINGMDYVDVSTLPTASASTMGKIYLLGPDASGYYSYYYTSYNGSAYSWVGPLGTTQISLANYATKTELGQLDQKVDGLIDPGTTYNTLAEGYNRVCVFYPIKDVNATYHLKVTNMVYAQGDGIAMAVRSAATPYTGTVLFNITNDTDFTIPEEYKSTAQYIAVNSTLANSAASFTVELYSIGLQQEIDRNESAIEANTARIEKLESDGVKLNNRVDNLDGILDDGTTYNTKDATNRVCVYYPIPNVNAKYRIKISSLALSDNTNSLYIAIRSGKTPYSATLLQEVANITADWAGEFFINDSVKSSAEYISVIQLTADGTASFKVDLQYDGEVAALRKEVLPIDKGTVYSEKFSTTNRTCIFYPIVDKEKEYRIIIDNATVPASNEVRVFVAKDMSPYDNTPTGNVLQNVGQVYASGEVLDKTFVIDNAKRQDAKYFAVCQHFADAGLCSFRVTLFETGTVSEQIEETALVVESLPGVSSDAIPYNDTVFANGRTLKIYNPYKNGGSNQYAGQLHCHSWNYRTYNDVMYKVPLGYTVEQVAAMTEEQLAAAQEEVNQQFAAAHKTVGYSFMTISNYDEFADYTKQPQVLPNDFLWLGDSFEANTGGWDETGQDEDKGAHLGIINTNFGRKFRNWEPREIVNYCEDKDCIVVYNHPFLATLYSSPEYVKNIKKRLRFIEVFNGLAFFHDELAPDVPYIKDGVELDEDFDALLTQGNFTFGIAASDERSLSTSGPGLKYGCVVVFANNLNHKEIVENLLAGNFYACAYLNGGIMLNGVTIDNGKYSVDVGAAGITVEFVGTNNTVLSTVTTTSGSTVADYNIVGNEKIIRARVKGTLNGQTTTIIWTQPMFISDKIL